MSAPCNYFCVLTTVFYAIFITYICFRSGNIQHIVLQTILCIATK
jgi:hypothetical protein